ncbi:HAMP domain-containing histidine kinase [bacterium]|nr:HAMP domain-containing histidine kinase [bacterium]
MKKQSTFYYVFIFVMAQIALFLLIGLWISWYVTNYILMEKGGIRLFGFNVNIVALVGGLALLIVISIAMTLIFMYLNRQMNLTKMYDNFIANITHELKSPLSSIQLFLETIKSREVGEKKQKEFILSMLNDVNRLNSLINSILYMSGFESSKTAKRYPHNYRVYRADEFLKKIIRDESEQLRMQSSVEITGDTSCRCVMDKQWMSIVFHNLLDNAKKYCTGDVKINVKFACTEKFFIVDVIDNGIGVPASYKKKIFNKFQRIENPNSPNVKGTGLGLYWVKEIIKYHGGDIFVFSEGENSGTTFTIKIPVYMATKQRHIKNLLKLSSYKMKKTGK